MEISPLICRVNQRIGFYKIGTSVMKELNSRLVNKDSASFIHFFLMLYFYTQNGIHFKMVCRTPANIQD